MGSPAGVVLKVKERRSFSYADMSNQMHRKRKAALLKLLEIPLERA